MNAQLKRGSQHEPPGMRLHTFTLDFSVDSSVKDVWRWLNDPRTFIDGQLPPYRVEFLPERFEVGVINNHHGPGLNLPAVITVMDAPKYREMQYLYGSYVASLRLIRPTALKFWLEEPSVNTCILRVELASWVHPWMASVWTIGQSFFWRLFGVSISRQVAAHRKRLTQ